MQSIFITILILVFSASLFAQGTAIASRCPKPSLDYARLETNREGNIFALPCPTKSLKMLDVNYASGLQPLVNNFSISNNDNIDNSTGGLIVTTNYLNSILDLELNATVGTRVFSNQYSALRVKGNTPNSSLFNHYIYTDNRWETSNSTSLYSIFASTNIESTATIGVGGRFAGLLGNFNATPLIIGVQGTAGGHGGGGQFIGGDFNIFLTNDGAVSPLVKGVRVQLTNLSINTFTDARGISLDNWVKTGSVINSYGIYADTTIDMGINRYFIYSLSTSPSRLSGDVYISDTNKGIILKSADGSCYRFTVANGGALNAGALVTCP